MSVKIAGCSLRRNTFSASTEKSNEPKTMTMQKVLKVLNMGQLRKKSAGKARES